MHKLLITLFFFGAFLRINCQTGVQAGVSVLPVIDVLNLYPHNDIQGVAITGNAGAFFTKNLCIGINPYYSRVANKYSYLHYSASEDLIFYGLNTYARYYFLNKNRFRLFVLGSAGLSHIHVERTHPGYPTFFEQNFTAPAFSLMGGAGANYFVFGNLALELNVSYAYLVTGPPLEPYFQTVLPTFGLQYFFKTKSVD